MPAARSETPSALVFDVNETLIDIEALRPQFEELFADASVLREWFGQLVLYSMAATLAGTYVDFSTLGRGVLRMIGEIHSVTVTDVDLEHLADGMQTLPAHPDVAEGLTVLREHGFRLATLTNSPPRPGAVSPLENAGLAGFFEHQFSVHELRLFKPATTIYTTAAAELGLAPAQCMMVAAHAWDTLGAQAAGMHGALLTRPGNAALPVPGLPQPTVVAADLVELAQRLTQHRTSVD